MSSDWGISDKKELLCVVIKQIPGNKVKPTLGRSVDKSYFTQKIPYAEQMLNWAWYYIVDEASVGMKNKLWMVKNKPELFWFLPSDQAI